MIHLFCNRFSVKRPFARAKLRFTYFFLFRALEGPRFSAE